MASVRQIAGRVGVSPATVSRVINNDPGVSEALREKVLAAANETRYVPKVGRRSNSNVAFVYTGESSLGSPFDAALMAGMGERMEEYGFDLMVVEANRGRLPGETYSQMLMRKGIRGAVLRTTQNSRHIAEAIADEGFPAVVVGDHFDSPNVSFIYCDSRGTSNDAVSHLIALGHRKIAVATNVVDDADHLDRLAGYRAAMLAHGIEVEERFILRTPARLDGGVQLMRRVRTMPNGPTALYIVDPMTAVGAMNEAMAMGLSIPKDLSIVGFDDADLRFMVFPNLSAVCQDTREIGRKAFEVLYGIIDQAGKPPLVRRKLETRFEMHGSSGPCHV